MHDTALIVIDVINTYDHEDAEMLVPSVRGRWRFCSADEARLTQAP